MRIEQDSIGDLLLNKDSYYGIQTARAQENFKTNGIKTDMVLIKQLAKIKKAAALANQQTGTLAVEKAEAIVAVVHEICDNQWNAEFIVEAIQGGAGTSTNMNVNEVIANRGLERLGHERGAYHYLHPLDDVNRSQSTNDVYPSAGKLATIVYIKGLVKALEGLIESLEQKAVAFASINKMGRTQLQEAVPTSVGASFGAYASNLKRCKKRLLQGIQELCQLNLGGTAIGTGVNASQAYREALYINLRDEYQLPLVPADNLIDATQNVEVFVIVSGLLKALAVSLSKLAHDLRLLASGPRSGFAELRLPSRQAGSSIMPGKVNPVIPEMVSQVAFQVIGNDATITFAAESGELELNAFEPIIFHNLFESCRLLEGACESLATKCIDGIQVNREKCEADVFHSTGTITELTPLIGYEKASKIVKEALRSNVSVEELLAKEQGVLSK